MTFNKVLCDKSHTTVGQLSWNCQMLLISFGIKFKETAL